MGIPLSVRKRILIKKTEVTIVKKVLLAAILFITSATMLAQTQQKIGYVDSQVILNQYSAAIKAQSDLDALVTVWRTELDSMAQALQAKYQSYEKQASMMTPEKQQEAQQEVMMMDQQINQFRQQKFGQPNGELYIKQEEFLAPVKEKIMAAIDEVAATENMNFVFDKSGDIVLLHADDQFDITFKVLDKLKSKK